LADVEAIAEYIEKDSPFYARAVLAKVVGPDIVSQGVQGNRIRYAKLLSAETKKTCDIEGHFRQDS
jgi:hypothetical protein